MNFTTLLVAIVLISAEAAMAAGGNDNFAQRKRLASQEVIEDGIRFVPSISFETLDPLTEPAGLYWDGGRKGTLWWEWTAPANGWFQAGVVNRDGVELDTPVFTGDSLERLIPVQNGNHLGLTLRGYSLFEARAGERYQITVKLEMPQGPEAGNPTLATLKIAPCPGPPANIKLERREVLAGTLPLRVIASNVAGPTEESHLIPSMTPVGSWYGVPERFGPMQWWEWTCPQTGAYVLRADGPGFFKLVARRKTTPGGLPGAAGDWETQPVPVEGETLSATGGAVYDFAVLSRPVADISTDRPFTTYTLQLNRVESQSLPSNTARESASPMPAGLPSVVNYHWEGSPLTAGETEWFSLWWVFTAPVDGLYVIDSVGSPMMRHYEEGRDHSASAVQYLQAGERVWMELSIYRVLGVDMRFRIDFLGAVSANDMLAQAVDLGSQREFRLTGHRSYATLEPDEPPSPDDWIDATGSLWWKWMAPENGWLRVRDSRADVPLQIFTGTDFVTGERRMIQGVESVVAGQTYMIRAMFNPNTVYETCAMHLDFLPRPENLSWQMPTDLGVVAQPSWRMANPWPAAFAGGERWFRWTAAESGHFDFSNLEFPATLYSDPATDLEVPRDEHSGTWELHANQTYWLKYSYQWTDAWFEMRRQVLAEHTDAVTAMTLPPGLPVAGMATTRGDVNSDAEIQLLRDFTWEGGLRAGTPAIWWKWQAPADQRVRCNVEALNSPLRSLVIFTGAGPVEVVIWENALHDSGGMYFPAKQGQTYWFASIGQDSSAALPVSFRLELWPVVDLSPVNDNFADSREIGALQWQQHGPILGVHGGIGWTNPLRFEWTRATLEPGEPPVSLIIGQDGNATVQSASTWWHWTAPGSGIYRLDLTLASPEQTNSGIPAGNTPDDLTADIYTGASLATLQPAGVYEPRAGQYCFRAQRGIRHTIRVASSSKTPVFALTPRVPQADDLYDFRAIERLDFEEVGNGMFSDTGDYITNFRKVLFGMDPHYSVDHPRNAAALANLPAQVIRDGMLEFQCRTDPVFATEGHPAGLDIFGEVSANMMDWSQVFPVAGPGGELVLRIPVTGDRQFLKWNVLGNLHVITH